MQTSKFASILWESYARHGMDSAQAISTYVLFFRSICSATAIKNTA
jgi:hypothetical protein